MKGYIEELSILNRQCSLYLPQEYYLRDKSYPVVYLNGCEIEREVIEEIESAFGTECCDFILLSIKSEDWNKEFTPWPAQGLSKKVILLKAVH